MGFVNLKDWSSDATTSHVHQKSGNVAQCRAYHKPLGYADRSKHYSSSLAYRLVVCLPYTLLYKRLGIIFLSIQLPSANINILGFTKNCKVAQAARQRSLLWCDWRKSIKFRSHHRCICHTNIILAEYTREKKKRKEKKEKVYRVQNINQKPLTITPAITARKHSNSMSNFIDESKLSIKKFFVDFMHRIAYSIKYSLA